MVKEAEDNAESDKIKKESVEAINQAESLIHSAEKTIKDLGEKADDNLKKEVESSIQNLNTALKDEDVEQIKEKTNELSSNLMKLGEVAYKENNDNQNTENNSSGDNDKKENKEEVVDADFEEVKPEDDKKNAS